MIANIQYDTRTCIMNYYVYVFECTDGDGSRTRGSTAAMAASYMTVINKYKIKVLIEDEPCSLVHV